MAIKNLIKIKRKKKQFKYLLNDVLKSNFSAIFDTIFRKDIGDKDFLNLTVLNKVEDVRDNLGLNISEYPKYILYGMYSVIFGMKGVCYSLLLSIPFTFEFGSNPIVPIENWLLGCAVLFIGLITSKFLYKIILSNKLLKYSDNLLSIPLYNTEYSKNTTQKELNNLGTIYDKNYFKILNDTYDYDSILKLLLNVDNLVLKSTKINGYQVFQNLMDAEIFQNISLNNQYKQYFVKKLNTIKILQFDTLRRKKFLLYNNFIIEDNTFGNLNYSKIYSSFVLFKDEKGLAIFKKHQMLFEIILNFLELQNNLNKNGLTEEEKLFVNDTEVQIKLFTDELDAHMHTIFQEPEQILKNEPIEEYNSKLKVLQLAINSRK